eukprot:1966121-Rhodomonas_salina.1
MPATRESKPRPETLEPKPETLDPSLQTLDFRPETHTLDLEACTPFKPTRSLWARLSKRDRSWHR